MFIGLFGARTTVVNTGSNRATVGEGWCLLTPLGLDYT